MTQCEARTIAPAGATISSLVNVSWYTVVQSSSAATVSCCTRQSKVARESAQPQVVCLFGVSAAPILSPTPTRRIPSLSCLADSATILLPRAQRTAAAAAAAGCWLDPFPPLLARAAAVAEPVSPLPLATVKPFLPRNRNKPVVQTRTPPPPAPPSRGCFLFCIHIYD